MRDSSEKKATPLLAGVVGWPIDHSLSPLIHTIWANRAGINGYYIPLAIAPDYDAFARAMDSLRVIGFAGVNVTLPHKEHALRYADKHSDTAASVGAANMLTFKNDGVYADNSDAGGFEAALRGAIDRRDAAQSAFILGAGGAARGVAQALRQFGLDEVTIANRTRKKAELIAEDFGARVIDWEKRNEALSAEIIVNTTSLGMTGQPPLELDYSRLKPGSVVADIVYSPLETPLLKAALGRGAVAVDGLAMLMHQAAPGFKAWFGGDAQVDEVLRSALVAELKRRLQA